VARGALRGAAAAWLGLIALQAVTSKGGAHATSGVLGVAESIVKRALAPNVAAIPDRRDGSSSSSSTPNLGATTDLNSPLPNFSTIPVPTGTGMTGGGGTTKHI
jgi:hypothetical protein